MFCFLLVLSLSAAADGEADFWDQLSDDEIVVEDKIEGKLYAKARFYLPIKRRLKLYPHVMKVVDRLQECVDVEFVYEAKTPSLTFLDSEDSIVENIEITKMTEDEIMALINMRGFNEDNKAEPVSEDAKEEEKGKTDNEEVPL